MGEGHSGVETVCAKVWRPEAVWVQGGREAVRSEDKDRRADKAQE